ncbi:MAG: hypothetical protein QW304_01675 [Thermoproteota archaeon]
MDKYRIMESKMVEDIKNLLCKTPEEFKAHHDQMLSEITEVSQKSPVYQGRVKKINSLEELNALPLTPYDVIYDCIKRFGLEKVLLAKPVKYWQTSGYTGEPKKFYYGQKDLDEIVSTFAMFGYILGIRPWFSGWNFGGRDPLLSASLIDMCAEKMQIEDYLSTPLGSENDFFDALKKASKRKSFDIMMGTPFLFELIIRVANNPSFVENTVEEIIRKKYKVPNFLAGLICKIFLHGMNYENLKNIVKTGKMGLTYTEAIAPYLDKFKKEYVNMVFYEGLGSTEMPFQAVQIYSDEEGLYYILKDVIPEIANPEDVMKAKASRDYNLDAVPWFKWEKGMRGELLITRPGECLPLIRYPTGDLIEVLDPMCRLSVEVGEVKLTLTLPKVKILGRTVDLVDFEVPEEMGAFIGGRIYTRQVNDALLKIPNVKWWELYNVKGNPGKLVFLVIPEKEVENVEAFKTELFNNLARECDFSVSIAYELKMMDFIITKPSAYKAIQEEISRRANEGRSLGQLKPKHIYTVRDEEEIKRHLNHKFQI